MNFPNIDLNFFKLGAIRYMDDFPLHAWEIEIRDSLIKKRDISLIKVIFPLFQKSTLSSNPEVFYRPIEDNDLELIKALVEGGMLPFHSRDHDSKPDVLLVSILFGRLQIMNYLLQHTQYDINAAYPFDKVYDNGVDIRDAYFGKDFHIVNASGNFFHRDIFLEADYITPANLAVRINHPLILQELIKLGADCNIPIPNQFNTNKSEHDLNNPLLYTLQKGYEKCFNLLINETNINLNFLGNQGKTPLLTALYLGQFSKAKALIEKGADVQLSDPESGNKPIMLAVLASNLPTLQVLLKAGADPGSINIYSKDNLWHLAVTSPHPEEMCQELLDTKAVNKIDEPNESGLTPLAEAIRHGTLPGVEALLKCGASTSQELNLSKSIRDHIERFFDKNKSTINLTDFAHAVLEETHENFKNLVIESRDAYNDHVTALKNIISILENSPKP